MVFYWERNLNCLHHFIEACWNNELDALQEGQQFLSKNLTEWKKPALLDHFDGETEAASSAPPKLSKDSTMKATAKVAILWFVLTVALHLWCSALPD